MSESTIVYRLECRDTYENWSPQWFLVGEFTNPGLAREHALHRVHNVFKGVGVNDVDDVGAVPGLFIRTDYRIIEVVTTRSTVLAEGFAAGMALPFLPAETVKPEEKFRGERGRDDLPAEQFPVKNKGLRSK